MNKPPDVDADGQNMFLDRGHKFPGLPVAARCALSPHLEHDLTKGEKKGRGREGLMEAGGGLSGKTRRSSREQTDSISPRLCTQRQTGKGSGEGVSNLFPEL